MASKVEFGQRGEKIAENYLLAKGHLILERNYRYNRSEIDLITKHNNTIIFTEVKTRSTAKYGEPEESVNYKKEKMMALGAEGYIEEHDINLDIRYDIIAIILTNRGHKITHIVDAFWPIV